MSNVFGDIWGGLGDAGKGFWELGGPDQMADQGGREALGSFFFQNESMPGLRILWLPLLAAGAAALGVGAAGAGGASSAGGAGSAGGGALAGEGAGSGALAGGGEVGSGYAASAPGWWSGTEAAPAASGAGTTSQPTNSGFNWQRYLRNQAINRGINMAQGQGQQGYGNYSGNAFGSSYGYGTYGAQQQQRQTRPALSLYSIGAKPALMQHYDHT